MTLKVNGHDHQVDADPDTPALCVVRNQAKRPPSRIGPRQAALMHGIVDARTCVCVTPVMLWRQAGHDGGWWRSLGPSRRGADSSAPSWKSRRSHMAHAISSACSRRDAESFGSGSGWEDSHGPSGTRPGIPESPLQQSAFASRAKDVQVPAPNVRESRMVDRPLSAPPPLTLASSPR